MCEYVCVSVCVCVCVCARARAYACACACVCLCDSTTPITTPNIRSHPFACYLFYYVGLCYVMIVSL